MAACPTKLAMHGQSLGDHGWPSQRVADHAWRAVEEGWGGATLKRHWDDICARVARYLFTIYYVLFMI